MTQTNPNPIRADAADDDEHERRAREIEETVKAADAKKRDDADIGAKLDRMTALLDAMASRVDALETNAARDRVDAEHRRAKDDDDEPEAARRLAADDDTSERGLLHLAQSRADEVANLFGERAPAPMVAEGLLAYRRRLAKMFKKHSAIWKTSDLREMDAKTFEHAEQQIYADASEVGRRPPEVGPGQLVARERRDDAGHLHRTFHGDPRSWMDYFAPVQLKATGGWRTPQSGTAVPSAAR